MQRLDGVLSTLRGLAVETTHEMRTPLASIRALAEVAASDRMSEYYALRSQNSRQLH